MSTSQVSARSAVARRSAEAEVHRLIAGFPSAHLPLTGATRRWLRKRLPTAHEVVYEYRDSFVISYSPTEHGYEGVFATRASTNGVRLYFHRGKELPDPGKLLQGSDKARWIHLEGASTLARPGGRAPERRGHLSQSRAVRARRPRVGGHSFDLGQAASPCLTC